MWGVAQLENFRLKVFRTVAQHLSFRKAAEHLFITQPAVTLQIKALEEDLGARLFDRKGNQIFLTAQEPACWTREADGSTRRGGGAGHWRG